MAYCQHTFGEQEIYDALYGALYAKQDKVVTSEIVAELK